jgi:hypothetical protein
MNRDVMNCDVMNCGARNVRRQARNSEEIS